MSPSKDPRHFFARTFHKITKNRRSSILAVVFALWALFGNRWIFFALPSPNNDASNKKAQTQLDSIEFKYQLRRLKDEGHWKLLGEGSISESQDERNRTGNEQEEADIAFFVQISNTNINLVPRLLSRIWHPKNLYCLHFDNKIPPKMIEMFRDALKTNKHLNNTFLMPSTIITYTGVSMVLNTLDSITTLLQDPRPWEYFINLSGSDYPLVSPSGLRRLLGQRNAKQKQKSFIHFSQMVNKWDRLVRHRLGILHFDLSLGFKPNLESELVESEKKHPVLKSQHLNISIPKGEAWFIAHRSFCQEAATGIFARRLITLFANMQSPSEHFFQTLVWNHEGFNMTTAKYSFRLVKWGRRDGSSRQHPLYLDERAENGTWKHWSAISRSNDFFMRKLRVADSGLMDHVDTHLSGASEELVNPPTVHQSFKQVSKMFTCIAHADSSDLSTIRACSARKRTAGKITLASPPPSLG
ncbi:Beta-glucuronosyltransferase GlcAT14B [Gracilariopsis chorda]|uniref:Beta-glucuronosyltransferase GlcAT14B n=1 Tax=Gracilariopsis chorda TaxID=448386 RepID=A0A2V3IUL7_9FLOR|nr:Beta-glucuronosyltransferase GlcAT14B [Gracilariopsis chorda]|eukprot:PXF45812.1 Beta-glucuronosyltransferase GlcAT14B [Gracilariopsis chorda]